MKTIINFMLAFVFVAALSSCEKDETIIAKDKLPVEAKSYLDSHFEGLEITQVVKDKEGIGNSYDVYLANGVSLEFTDKGEIESIKGTSKLPNSVIPEKIRVYVETHYPTEFIREWDVDLHDQEIQLSSGLELIFSKEGDYLRIDQ